MELVRRNSAGIVQFPAEIGKLCPDGIGQINGNEKTIHGLLHSLPAGEPRIRLRRRDEMAASGGGDDRAKRG